MDNFRIFNKIKVDTEKYEQVETNNNEKLKLKISKYFCFNKWIFFI